MVCLIVVYSGRSIIVNEIFHCVQDDNGFFLFNHRLRKLAQISFLFNHVLVIDRLLVSILVIFNFLDYSKHLSMLCNKTDCSDCDA